MTILCLKVMQQELKFNICGLKSSYRMNNQVENKESLVEKCIPSYLAYACQYWADHLRGITAVEQRDTDIVYLLRSFLNTQLLYWLEVLSLLSKSYVAPKSLLMAAEWLEVSSIAMLSFRRYYRRTMAKDLSLIAADASRFSSLTFADVISARVRRTSIYLLLPFAPPSSLVSETIPRSISPDDQGLTWRGGQVAGHAIFDFDGRLACTIFLFTLMEEESRSRDEVWRRDGFFYDHGRILVPPFRPRGKRPHYPIRPQYSSKKIATGTLLKMFMIRTVLMMSEWCDVGRLRIYETENGSLLVGPFNLHPDRIRSVAWSPDGQRWVSMISLCTHV